MNNKKEFKAEYNHSKAKEILKILGAKLLEHTVSEELYLLDDGKNIWKLSKTGNRIRLVHLRNQAGSFLIELKTEIKDKKICEELTRLFKTSSQKMEKEREHYQKEASKIVLDKIHGLGQFIELYPDSEEEKRALFDAFHIQSSDLIDDSYNILKVRK